MLQTIKNYYDDFMGRNDEEDTDSRISTQPSITLWKELLERHRFGSLLPYESYDYDNGIYSNTDAIGFCLEVTPSTYLNESMLRSLSSLLSNDVKEDTSIQIVMYASPDVQPWLDDWKNERIKPKDYKSTIDEKLVHSMTQKRCDYLANGNWKSFFHNQPQVVRDFRCFISVMRPKPQNKNKERFEIENLTRMRNSMKGTLKSSGLYAVELRVEEMLNLMDTILNPRHKRAGKKAHQKDVLLNEQIVDLDTRYHIADEYGLHVTTQGEGGKETAIRSYTASEFPGFWPGWLMNNLLGSPDQNQRRVGCPFLITLNLSYGDQLGASGEAKTKSMRATQMRDTDAGKYIPNYKVKAEEWQYVEGKLSEGHTMARMNFMVTLFADLETIETEQERLCSSIYKSEGWKLVPLNYVHAPAFLQSLPLGLGPSAYKEAKALFFWRRHLSWTCTNFMPLTAEFKGNGIPLLMLVGRRGQISYFDPWANQSGNYNIAYAAKSGSGKSFAVAEIVSSILGIGGRAWILDRGRSYENLCRIYGGQFIDFTADSDICINPFTNVVNWTGHDEDVEGESTGSELLMLKQLVAQMVTGKGEQLSKVELAYIEEALNHVWESKGRKGNISDVSNFLMNIEDEDARAIDIGKALFPFTEKGAYGRFFNGPANINFSKDFVVLETKELDSSPDLQSVVVMLLMLKITQSAYSGSRGRRWVCIMDEAWKLFGEAKAAEFIEEGYRTARKYNGSFVTITQSLMDYHEKGPGLLACLENSDYTILMQHKADSINNLVTKNLMPLAEDGARILRSLETEHGMYSELAIFGPNGVHVGRLIVDPFCEKLYTTKGTEFDFIESEIAKGKTLVDALEMLAATSDRS